MERPQLLAERHETRAATFYSGRRVPRSGSGDAKGDVITEDELIECKHTERISFGLMYRMFYQHMMHAVLSHRRAVMDIEFTSPRGGRPLYLVVLDRDEYLGMRDELRQLRRSLAEMVAERQREL